MEEKDKLTEISLDNGRVTIILHSGSYDRACNALWIAISALASRMEAHILLTYEGLKRFTKEQINDLGDETPAQIQPDIKFGLEAGIIQPLDELIETAKDMGLNLYACPNALATLKIPFGELVGVDEAMGLVGFLALSRTANVNLYI
ncbi:hypothetical protein ACFLWR_01585 [Chloroflexota bacterium]